MLAAAGAVAVSSPIDFEVKTLLDKLRALNDSPPATLKLPSSFSWQEAN
jgi:hypothetical protein